MRLARAILAVGLLHAVVVTSRAAGDDCWWKALGNETLTAAVEFGLEQHPSVSAAAAAIRSARAARDAAEADGRPRLDVRLGARVGQERTGATGFETEASDPYFGSALMTWELDVLGRIDARESAAEALVDVAAADRRGVELMLSSAIALTLINIAAESDRLGYLETWRAHQTNILRRAERRRAAGVDSGASVDVERARLSRANHRTLGASIRLKRLRAELAAWVGEPYATNVIDSLATISLPASPDMQGMTNVVQRPDIARAWQAVRAARATSLAASRDRYPTLSLMASAAGEVSGDGETEPWQAWIGPVLELPLWKPALAAREARDSARAMQALRVFESASREALRELSQAVTERTYAEAMEGYMRARATELERIAESALRRRDAGLIEASEWLRAEQDVLEARNEAVEWRRRAFQSHLSLIRAWGGDPGMTAAAAKD